jgi:tetratricopeptide (TPR) repeat protein
MGDHANGLATFTESLRIMRELGDPGLEAKLLNNIGDLRLRAGEVESAQAAFREALTLSKASGTETDRAVMHMNVATTLDAREEFDTAVETLNSALAVFRRFGDLNHETICLNALGTVYLEAGRSAEAKIHYESALRMARELGISGQEAEATRGLGTAEGALDQLAPARRHLETAAALALRIGSPEEEALACEALAGLVLRDGDAEGARELLQRALALWEPFNDKAAGRVRQTLAGIDHPESGSWQKEA